MMNSEKNGTENIEFFLLKTDGRSIVIKGRLVARKGYVPNNKVKSSIAL